MISLKKDYNTPHLTQFGSLVQLTLANYPVGPTSVKTDPAVSPPPMSAPTVPGKDGAEVVAPPPSPTDLTPPAEGKDSAEDDPSTGGITTPPAPVSGSIKDPPSGTEEPAKKDEPEEVVAPPKDLAPPAEGKDAAGDDPSTGGITTPPASISGSIKGPPSGTEEPAKKNEPKDLAPSAEGKDAAGAGAPAPPKAEERTKDAVPAPPKAEEKKEEKKDAPQAASVLPAMGGTALPAIVLFGRRLWQRLRRRPGSE